MTKPVTKGSELECLATLSFTDKAVPAFNQIGADLALSDGGDICVGNRRVMTLGRKK